MLHELVQQTKNLTGEMLRGIHTAIPGVIVEFDPNTSTAVIEPKAQLKDNTGKKIAYPLISGVPLCFMQGMNQRATIACPVKSGDGCLLIITEQALDYWLYGKETDIDLCHDLTSAIAIPGLFVKSNPIMREACEQEAVIIDREGVRVIVTEKDITLKGNVTVEGSVTVTGEITARENIIAGVGGEGPVTLLRHMHYSVPPDIMTGRPAEGT